MSEKKCKTKECGRVVRAKGLCGRCYQKRWRKLHREEAKAQHEAWLKKHPGYGYALNKNWRQKYPDKRNEERRRNYLIGAEHNRNGGESYSTLEEIMILFKITIDSKKVIIATGVKDRELAKCLGRTVQAIQVQRCLIKKNPSHTSNLTSIKEKLESNS